MTRRAWFLALASEGRSNAARMAMMAITRSNSMSVKADFGKNLPAGRKIFSVDGEPVVGIDRVI
jgi:hypothetical protein